jgi:hypothetical protein
MDDLLVRVWHDLVERTTGPMWFRLILQPLVATVYGVRAGLANARRGKDRQSMFRQALQDIGKVFAIGVGLDAIFQFIALRTVHPIEAVVVGFFLVAVPYQIVRSIVAWFASRSRS